MIQKMSHVTLFVNNQDEAKDFYVNKLDFEVRTDHTMDGGFRWLTVGAPGQGDVAVTLMAIPGPPVMDEQTAKEVRALMAKGFAGTIFLVTDDCRVACEEMRGRGVEFTEAPEERPYGIDCGFRDPSGNSLRLTEPRETTSS